jgi:hypothetical protein
VAQDQPTAAWANLGLSPEGGADFLLLDEPGDVQIDPRGAELIFQIGTERDERASIGIGRHCCVLPSHGSSEHDPGCSASQMAIARSSKAMRSRWWLGASVAMS